jgi:hypothetical protein
MELLSRKVTGRDYLIYIGVVRSVMSKEILKREYVDWIKIFSAELCGDVLRTRLKTFAFRKRRRLFPAGQIDCASIIWMELS